MLYRVFKLTMMQLGDKMDLGFIYKKNKLIIDILYKILGLSLLFAVIFVLLYLLKNILFIDVDRNLLILIVTILQLFSIISATGGLITSMYLAKDNQLLFSFPAKHNEVFLSKIAVFFVYELLKNISYLIPFFVAYGLSVSIGSEVWIGYWFMIPLMLFILSLVPILVGVIISIPLMFTIRWLKERPLLSGVVLLTILVSILTFILRFIRLIPKNIRFIAMYNYIYNQINATIMWVVNHSLYYKNIINIILNNNLFTNFAIVIIIFLTVGIFAYLVARPLYFKMAVSAYEFSNKRRYLKKESSEKGPFASYASKEFKLLIRSSDSIIGNFIYLFSMPFILFLFNMIMGAFNIKQSGMDMLLSFNILLGLVLIISSNSSSASAFSKEGGQFYLLKIAPIEIKKQAFAKIMFNMLISTIVILITSVAIAFSTDISGINMVFMSFLFLLVGFAHIVWSLEIDMMHPDFKEFETSETVKESKNIKSSISVGIVISLIVSIISFATFMINYETAWVKLIIMAIIFLITRVYLFINRLNVYFKEIEM